MLQLEAPPAGGSDLPNPLRLFLNGQKQLRNGWWVAVFFAVLALLLFPTLLISQRFHHEVSIWEQALLIAIATMAVQALRRKPIIEVTGSPGLKSLKHLGEGMGWGFLLMAAPAAVLWLAGWVSFEVTAPDPAAIWSAVAVMGGVAVAEELLFRGVLFQRLIAGAGLWPAQVAVGLLFVLTHLGNPGMDGDTRLLAGTNIFLASILFGQAFVRSKGLAVPIGLHFMANLTQGVLLGFGVSGNAEPALLSPRFLISGADWVTGGAFGLEASLPGLITLALVLGWFVFGRQGAEPAPAPVGPPLGG